MGVREEAELEIQCGRVCPPSTLLEAVRLDDVTEIVWAELGEGQGPSPSPPWFTAPRDEAAGNAPSARISEAGGDRSLLSWESHADSVVSRVWSAQCRAPQVK